jgi:hypothetical protein
MKAIVTNLVLGSVACVFYSATPVWAEVSSQKVPAKTPAIVSAKALKYQELFLLPPAFSFEVEPFDYSISLDNKEYIKNLIEQGDWGVNQSIFNSNPELTKSQTNSFKKNLYVEQSDRQDLVFGKHDSFWQSENQEKYWGLTTVKTWGDHKPEEISLKNLDYLNAAPVLAPGVAALTISGGSQENLVETKNTLLGEKTNFRGGVAFHQSLAEEVTVGLGVVYEDFLLGFSQLTYQPDNFPVRTTVSLLQDREGLKLSSHLNLKPTDEFVVNLYADESDQKFDFNWSLLSGITLTANGSSKTESLRAGARLAYKNEYFSFLAKAQLDNHNQIRWEVKSNLGDLKLKFTTNEKKTNTEIKYDFEMVEDSGFQCSLFFTNQIKQKPQKEERLAVWGWHLYAPNTMAKEPYKWEINLGYGFGSEGAGAIASFGAAINSSLSLKLSYEEVSLSSDTTQIKLQLSSK